MKALKFDTSILFEPVVSGVQRFMAFIDRIPAIQSALKDLYEQLEGEEEALRLAPKTDKVRIKQMIRSTWKDIRQYEQEYSATLSQQVKRQDLPESVAEVVVAEIVDVVKVLEPLEQRDEVKGLLVQILAELQKPGVPASAKLKVAIPIIPSLVSYELEGDTEMVVRRLFPTFVKVYEGLRLIGPGDPPKK
jgi:hypothetical protein